MKLLKCTSTQANSTKIFVEYINPKYIMSMRVRQNYNGTEVLGTSITVQEAMARTVNDDRDIEEMASIIEKLK